MVRKYTVRMAATASVWRAEEVEAPTVVFARKWATEKAALDHATPDEPTDWELNGLHHDRGIEVLEIEGACIDCGKPTLLEDAGESCQQCMDDAEDDMADISGSDLMDWFSANHGDLWKHIRRSFLHGDPLNVKIEEE